jgi:hypothetical protein
MPKYNYAVMGTINKRRVSIRKFRGKKYAIRFKNLIKVTGKEFPSKMRYKNVRVKKLT